MSLALQLAKLPAHFCGHINADGKWFKVQEYILNQHYRGQTRPVTPRLWLEASTTLRAGINRAFRRAIAP